MNDEKNRSGHSELHLCAHHGANADAEIGRLPNCDLRVAGCNRRVVQNASARCALKCNISKPPFCAAGPKIMVLLCSPAQLLSKE